MLSRFLVIVILFSQLGLVDAYAGRFDGLRGTMARAGVQIQRRTFIPVGRPPRLPAENHGSHSNGSNPWGWGVATAGVGGAAFWAYQMKQDTKQKLSKFLGEIKADEIDKQDAELPEPADDYTEQFNKILLVLEPATAQDLSSSPEALETLRQTIATLKQVYCSEDSAPSAKLYARFLLDYANNNKHFTENLKTANALEGHDGSVANSNLDTICHD